jgi:hypothetical protein
MIFRWLRRPARPRRDLGHLNFLVYTRQGCHLCDDAWDRLRQWQRDYGFPLDSIDVDTNPELKARYGEKVPVVTVNGKERFRGCVNLVLLKRLLEAEAKKAAQRSP